MSHHLGPVLGVSSPQVSQVANTVAAGLLTAYGLLRFTRAPRRTPITRRLVCVVELSFAVLWPRSQNISNLVPQAVQCK